MASELGARDASLRGGVPTQIARQTIYLDEPEFMDAGQTVMSLYEGNRKNLQSNNVFYDTKPYDESWQSGYSLPGPVDALREALVGFDDITKEFIPYYWKSSLEAEWEELAEWPPEEKAQLVPPDSAYLEVRRDNVEERKSADTVIHSSRALVRLMKKSRREKFPAGDWVQLVEEIFGASYKPNIGVDKRQK